METPTAIRDQGAVETNVRGQVPRKVNGRRD